MYALREHADEQTLAKIDKALEPPRSMRVNGRPAWYGSDEDAWAQFQAQLNG